MARQFFPPGDCRCLALRLVQVHELVRSRGEEARVAAGETGKQVHVPLMISTKLGAIVEFFPGRQPSATECVTATQPVHCQRPRLGTAALSFDETRQFYRGSDWSRNFPDRRLAPASVDELKEQLELLREVDPRYLLSDAEAAAGPPAGADYRRPRA